jgi:1-acyl-sn-glycerol-3-phosphate acyltransferase
MIKAKHQKYPTLIFNFYLKFLLKRNFSHFWIINDLPSNNDLPLLVTPNHFSCWDGFFIQFAFNKLSARRLNILMLEEQLEKYTFFNRIGAFSLKRDNPKELIKGQEYISTLLNDSNNYVVIYPQGEILPFHQRPLKLKKGITYFIKDAPDNLLILPVAIKIEYSELKKPSIYLRFGTSFTKQSLLNQWDGYEGSFLENLDSINSFSGSGLRDLLS